MNENLSLHERIKALLDWDEGLIFPDMYQTWPGVYKDPSVVYLVQDRDGTPESLDIVWPNKTRPDFLELDVRILTKMLHVRYVEPLKAGILPLGEIISKAEFMENADEWVVMSTLLVVRQLEYPRTVSYISYGEYLQNFQEYELIDVSYYAVPAAGEYFNEPKP